MPEIDLPRELERGSPAEYSDHLEHVRELLKRTIARAGFSQKEVERRLGWGDGYISQILRGKVVFKLKHCFAILAVIGVPSDDFFAELYTPSALPASAQAPPAPMLALGSEAALREQVEEIVREVLARR